MTERPNILMICSDQHAARITGLYGDKDAATPNLDALAVEGCRFDSFYCNDPVCVPSRMSLMTGRFPFRCESISNSSVLDSRIPTMAHMAVRGGYHPVLAGKMHFNGPDQRHGFLERLVGEAGSCAVYGGADLPECGLSAGNLGNCSRPEPLQFTGAGGTAYAEYDKEVAGSVSAWLERYAGVEGDKPPFFMVAGFLLPHCPYIAPRDLFDKYYRKVRAPRISSGELDSMHPHHRAYREFIGLDDIPDENLDKAVAAYYGLVEQLDCNIGLLIEALKGNGLWDNTIVVYFSDHGEMLGSHGRWHKDCFRESAVRVPMIIRHPGEKQVASVSTPASLVDLMPTFCEWVGVEPPHGIDGESLVPFMKAGKTDASRVIKSENYAYWDYGDWKLSSNRMILSEGWKLCCYGAYGSCELFNMNDDPGETCDIAGRPEYAPVVKRLLRLAFEDGWSFRTADDTEGRLDEMGHSRNIREYARMLRKDSLPVDAPDYWRGIATARTWIEPDEQEAGLF